MLNDNKECLKLSKRISTDIICIIFQTVQPRWEFSFVRYYYYYYYYYYTHQEDAAVSERPVLLTAMFPRHLEHSFTDINPLQAGDDTAVDQVLQPRTQKHALASFTGNVGQSCVTACRVVHHGRNCCNCRRLQRIHHCSFDQVSNRRRLTKDNNANLVLNIRLSVKR